MRVLAVLVLLVTLSACETVKGLGRDISNAGQAIDRAV